VSAPVYESSGGLAILPLGANTLPLGASGLPFRRLALSPILHYFRLAQAHLLHLAETRVVTGKILVIDDDDSTLRSLQRLLETAGLPCAGYESAEQVLASDACDEAACVVSDQKLPGMSGLELLADMRARNVTLPFILITANDSPGVRAEASARGAMYLAKPFLGGELLDAIEAAIEGSKR
jgi:two-component system response regulator FixJ